MHIELENIGLHFGDLRALHEINLQVPQGEVFGFIGPDGAGKTSLFRIMASLILPHTGTCSMWGMDTVKDYKEVRQMIGYMPGRFSLYMDLSVEENLEFYARVFGTTVSANYDLVKVIYEQIAPFRKRRAGKLSGGMKQKLALSCALIHRPRVLILDEPTTGVDAVSRQEFWEMLSRIREEGITILVSTPYMDEAERCDRVALMHKGRILASSSPLELGKQGGEKLLSLRGPGGSYAYLDALRSMPEIRAAWLSGDAIHAQLQQKVGQVRLQKALESLQEPGMSWEFINAGIEDRFIGILLEEERHD